MEDVSKFQQAISFFNQQEFFDCHEVLEDLWRPLPLGSEKTFLQGLIQVAVGFHHLKNRNFVGTKNKLQAGLEKLENSYSESGYQSTFLFDPVINSVRQALETVLALGPDRLSEFPAENIPQIQEAPPGGGASLE